MVSLYECGTWTLTLNGVELMGLADMTAERRFVLPGQTHELQIEPYLRGDGVSVWDRENISHNFSLTVVRDEASESAARAAMAAHIIELQDIGDGNAVMLHTDGTGLVYLDAGLANAQLLYGEELRADQWGMTYQLELGRAADVAELAASLTCDNNLTTIDADTDTVDAA